MIGPTSPTLGWRANQWCRILVRIEVNSLPVKSIFLAQSVPLQAAYHHFLSPVSGAIVRKDQTLDKWGSWKPQCSASSTHWVTHLSKLLSLDFLTVSAKPVLNWYRTHCSKMKFGVDMYTWLYLKQIANQDLCIVQGPCSVFCNNPNGKGIWKRIKINKISNIEKKKSFFRGGIISS